MGGAGLRFAAGAIGSLALASVALASSPDAGVGVSGSGLGDLLSVRDVLNWYVALVLYDATIGGGGRLASMVRRRAEKAAGGDGDA